MLLDVCREFPSIRDPRKLGVDEIAFFYDDLKPTLIERWRLHQRLKSK